MFLTLGPMGACWLCQLDLAHFDTLIWPTPQVR